MTTSLPAWASSRVRRMNGSWGGWADMNTRNVNRILAAEKKGRIDFVMYGDSITAYHFGYSYASYKPPASDAIWKKYFGDLNAVPVGIPGDQIGHLWYRMAKGGEMPSTPPKVIALLIGINDCARFGEDVSKPRVPANADRMDLLLKWIHDTMKDTEVVVCAVTPTAKTAIVKDRNALNAATKALVTKHKALGMRVVYADCSASFTAASGAPKTSGYLADNVHLTAKGHDVFLKSLRVAVTAALVRAPASTPGTTGTLGTPSPTTATTDASTDGTASSSSRHLMIALAACIACFSCCLMVLMAAGAR